MWYYRPAPQVAPPAPIVRADPNRWLDQLYSQSARESGEAAKYVAGLGPAALPAIRRALADPAAERPRRKAALKACAVLGPVASPALAEVTAALLEPDLTVEAAVALSFMGPDALAPLRDALASEDAIVRRESLRSIGKLEGRAPLDPAAVVPLLVEGIADPDPGVRAVAATYLGIIHVDNADSVSALIVALTDADADVRRSAAAALGSFGSASKEALTALKKAAVDPDEDVAREAGLTLVKLQTGVTEDPKPAARSRPRRR
jgi:HEAT repeat protein